MNTTRKFEDPRNLGDKEVLLFVAEILAVLQGVSYNQAARVLNETKIWIGEGQINTANLITTESSLNKTSVTPEEFGHIIFVLQRASMALSASHNLTVTDRPDLPLNECPPYVLDHKKETDAIGDLLLSFGFISTDSDR